MTKILLQISVLGLAVLSAQTASAAAQIYPLQGEHSAFGPYHGALEVRPRPDGGADVIRIVTYDRLQFENRRVEQVWSGQGEINGGTLTARFDLKTADIFNRVDEKTRQPEDFKRRLTVAYSIGLDGGGTAAVTTDSGTEADAIAGPPAAAGEKPLWRNQRVAIPARGESFRTLGDIAIATVFRKLIAQLHEIPFVQAYRGREEFESRQQYFISDKTDFEFLRAHPEFLRVTNKVVDEISLFESGLRANAYGPTLAQKQELFEEEILEGINEVGLLGDPVYDEAGRRIGSNPPYDGALWSGMYAGALAMRWKLTRDPAALATFRRVVSGILMLMDVTGDPKTFARNIAPLVPGEVMPEKWQQGAPPYQHLRFLQWGNNDMAQGLYYAMAWAYEVLPEGDPLLADVSQHALRLKDLQITTKKWHSSNIVRASGLKTLASGRTLDLVKYLAYYDLLDGAKDAAGLDDGFFYEGIADWSGVNLITISNLTNILIAKNLLRKMPLFAPRLRNIVRDTRQNLADTAAVYAGARRDFVTLAADAFAVQSGTALDFPADSKNIRAPKDWLHLRDEAKWTLREIPMLRTRHAAAFDRSWDPEWCVSAWPSLPWKYLGGERRIERFVQGAYAYPLFERQGNETNNVFTGSPFRYQGSERKDVSAGRMDYLHAFWLGRLSGAVGADD